MSRHGSTRTKDVNNYRNIEMLKYRNIVFLLMLLAFAPKISAQLNTDRITAIGRNALYFEDYVLSISRITCSPSSISIRSSTSNRI